MTIRPYATLFAVAIALTACAQAPTDSAAASATSATTDWAHYRCDSGQAIQARYHDHAATVRYHGATHAMTHAVAASGARYVGATLEWWTKGRGEGSEGLLLQHLADGNSGDTIETCVHIAASDASASP